LLSTDYQVFKATLYKFAVHVIYGAWIWGSSNYDIHMEGRGQAQLDSCGWREGSAPYESLQEKLEPTEVILFSSHTRK